jgi:hypothetical protein
MRTMVSVEFRKKTIFEFQILVGTGWEMPKAASPSRFSAHPSSFSDA